MLEQILIIIMRVLIFRHKLMHGLLQTPFGTEHGILRTYSLFFAKKNGLHKYCYIVLDTYPVLKRRERLYSES